ncbi:scavenger receptor cysteine-rich type 1 protein M130-like [Lytechinus pictus]|uniref:scavenger receptor cysteine-rich type 1 protein M130-like n=1 Tax=Lytechinus pictus TaxID=7653 RepID=UPI0030B9F06E
MAAMNLKLILCILPGLIAVSSAARQYQAGFQAMSSGYPHAGLVKVYIDGAWGTICASDWDMNDAEVVCRELGKGYPNTITVSGTLPSFAGPKCISSVKCYGHEERLSDCIIPSKITRANGNNDKGIVCFPPPNDAGLRLRYGPDQYSGYVEVKLSSGSWSKLYLYYYNYNWDLSRYQYIPNICRQLGFGELNWWDSFEYSSTYSMTKVRRCPYGVADHRSCIFYPDGCTFIYKNNISYMFISNEFQKLSELFIMDCTQPITLRKHGEGKY